MSNQWVEHVRKYAKANNITYMCAITEASKTYKKPKNDKLKSTPKNESKASPKEQPKVNKISKYRISVVNKKEDKSSFDFNFSRDFEYKIVKTDLGYDFIFNNLKDYDTAKDITMYNMDYKNPRLYTWIYHNDKTTPPKASPKPEASPKAPPKAQPKITPKEQDDIKYIRLIEDFLEKYDNSSLKKQIAGNTFDDRKQKALEIIEEVDKDAIEINDLKNKMLGDDLIDIMDLIQNNNALFSKFLKRQPQSVGNYIKKLVKGNPKPQPKPKAQPTKKDNVIEDIVNEWDTPQIFIMLFQTNIGNDMRITIEKLVRNKKFVFPPDLFFSNDAKMLLEELVKKYSIHEIDEVIIDYITYIDEDAKFPPNKDYYPLYQKRLRNPTLNRILKSSSFLGKKQTEELGLK